MWQKEITTCTINVNINSVIPSYVKEIIFIKKNCAISWPENDPIPEGSVSMVRH